MKMLLASQFISIKLLNILVMNAFFKFVPLSVSLSLESHSSNELETEKDSNSAQFSVERP